MGEALQIAGPEVFATPASAYLISLEDPWTSRAQLVHVNGHVTIYCLGTHMSRWPALTRLLALILRFKLCSTRNQRQISPPFMRGLGEQCNVKPDVTRRDKILLVRFFPRCEWCVERCSLESPTTTRLLPNLAIAFLTGSVPRIDNLTLGRRSSRVMCAV